MASVLYNCTLIVNNGAANILVEPDTKASESGVSWFALLRIPIILSVGYQLVIVNAAIGIIDVGLAPHFQPVCFLASKNIVHVHYFNE